MRRSRGWQFWVIVIVTVLTIYNILPTVFYYSKPLKKPIDKKKSESIAIDIMKRVNVLRQDSISWLKSYCEMLKIKPRYIKPNLNNAQHIDIEFYSAEDAGRFKAHFRRAGSLMSFVPSQLSISDNQLELDTKKITVQRQIPIQFDISKINSFFDYAAKLDDKNNITTLYKTITFDRAREIAAAVAGTSENAILLDYIIKDPASYASKNMLYTLVHDILDFSSVFDQNTSAASRFFASFTQGSFDNPKSAVQTLLAAISNLKDEIKLEKIALKKEEDASKFPSDDQKQKLYLLNKRENALVNAQGIIKNNINKFAKGQRPLTYQAIDEKLNASFDPNNPGIVKLDLHNNNPFINQLIIDFENDKITLTLQKDIIQTQESLKDQKKDLLDQLLINELARLSTKTDENILSQKDEFTINSHTLENTKSYLILNLPQIAKILTSQILNTLKEDWNPSHSELKNDSFPIYDYETYQKLPPEQKQFCLVIYSPTLANEQAPAKMSSGSIYVIAKGLNQITRKYQNYEKTQEAQEFNKDIAKLQSVLAQNGYLGFPGTLLSKSSEFSSDFIFENDNYYQTLLKATREDFNVYGSKKYAILEFTNVAQRLLTINKIETSIQEDLLKWRDDYNSAQVNIDPSARYDFPSPAKNVLFSNLYLSFKKYFRGDERKILHWGLDLSGGKTVRIELRDQNNRVVKDEAALKQGTNELYNRVNNMGVSEVSIRTIDNNIVLDFPGAQGLSARELVKASSMSFHIVNEKFSMLNANLSEHVNKFLQEVWNEAIVTNKKDIQSINYIAYGHLYGKSFASETVEPTSESAKILYENGLRLASFDSTEVSSAFNDSISKIAMFRGDDSSQWQHQTNPLLIVFSNYALEGQNLINIRSAYDPSQGNYLTFEVRGSYANKEGIRINPREELHAWTSQFSKDKIAGTPLEIPSRGQGWRMAVILNDYIISSPTLKADLKDSAMITGSFSLREVNQLAADLKAGSLSFTPRILSEKNVSPELGTKERVKGIIATFLSLALVIGGMIYYYRFAGLVASVAVFFNLIIMWATLQNLNAALTLAGIAGIILTVGMAVDANVLVFERTREEFAISGRIAPAIQNGYKKAFSAIFDSNVTTIIAALILLHFDSGPIKGFAVTLIIGIVSSMFTALFMTKFFFNKWVQNPNNTKLSMLHLVKSSNFNFLKYGKYVFIGSALIILLGGFMLVQQRKSVFGMDFTGGFSLNVEVQKMDTYDYRSKIEAALLKNGASSNDFNVRELNPSNNLRILLGTSMDLKGKPFYEMPLDINVIDKQYNYETNPRIAWVVKALESQGIKITPASLEKLDQNWTLMSGQMSDSMRNNAIWGLSLALIALLVYITFRFEFKFAISAMICTFHDVLITVAFIPILNLLGIPLQIDLNTVAALMTIIGFSLNDTIVIFDRIREDISHMRKHTFTEIINHSINITLSRTVITSGTVLLALLGLVFLGGSTIFGFSLVMIIGVVFGTLSSIFIASPLMLLFHNMQLKKELTFNNQEK